VISVAELLTHTGGFPYAPLGPERWNDRDKRLEAFGRWRLNWEPGSRFEYHATSAHWVLAEIIERRAEMDHREFARRYVTGPMGLDELFVGLPSEFDHRVAEVRQMVPPVEPPGGWGQVTPDALLVFNEPENRRIGVPGGGAVTGAAELAMLYQPLLNGGAITEGTRIVKEGTIEIGTRVLRATCVALAVLLLPSLSATGALAARSPGATRRRDCRWAIARTASPTGSALPAGSRPFRRSPRCVFRRRRVPSLNLDPRRGSRI
jgi:CubicO group peptidase (beta-lactamase class C family)